MNKFKAILFSLLWCLIILAFPIASGVIASISKLDKISTIILQGSFMLLSLVVPLVFLLTKKWNFKEIGFNKITKEGAKNVLYFLPLLLIFIPCSVQGFHVESIEYFFANLYLYLFVGIAEELYFRGIIPYYLGKAFSTKWIIIISSLIFALGHSVTILTDGNIAMMILTVINALIFGFLTIEMYMLCKNIIPGMFIHFLFDFETKFILMNGNNLLIAEIIRGTVMTLIAIYFAIVLFRKTNKEMAVAESK
jgi:membrane protease YdiL (CAAX protease family)